jgi:hypothetical protein
MGFRSRRSGEGDHPDRVTMSRMSDPRDYIWLIVFILYVALAWQLVDIKLYLKRLVEFEEEKKRNRS